MQVKSITENDVMAEARFLYTQDRDAGMRLLEPGETLPWWDDLPAHSQALYVRIAARGMGFPLPPELEAA